MNHAKGLLAIACLLCSPWAAVQAQANPPVLLDLGGLVQTLQVPILGEPLVNAINRTPLLQSTLVGQNPDITGGVPGIDGLNFSPAAIGQALRGLDPGLVEALFANARAPLRNQISQDLNRVLPGLQDPQQPPQLTLPGLDGLPVVAPK